jgi:glutamate--cysteine ligase
VTTLEARRVVPSLEELRLDVVSRFRQGGSSRADRPRRIGAEIEFLVSDATTRRSVPIEPDERSERATLPILRVLAERSGWRECRAQCGAPAFALPNGGELSFEPGGQIEYSAPPVASASMLIEDLRHVASTLREMLESHGIVVGEVGIDPCTPLDDTPLQLSNVSRYREMDAYFSRIGRSGARMMRQTASLQVSVDGADDSREVWRVLNAAAPYALAVFANSPIYERECTGHQSYRAAAWRGLDVQRTGLRAASGLPDEYLSFALDAPAMFLGAADGRYRCFREWLERGTATREDWRTHLTTLFPEVRPRGHFEVRSCDAVPAQWYAAPILFFAGLAYDRPARQAALDVLADAASDTTLLARAGVCGVHDDEIRYTALELFEIALGGCGALGHDVVSPALIAEARDFVQAFPARGRSLADERVSFGFGAR